MNMIEWSGAYPTCEGFYLAKDSNAVYFVVVEPNHNGNLIADSDMWEECFPLHLVQDYYKWSYPLKFELKLSEQ